MNQASDIRVAAVIQARMGSSRLPGKVMMEVLGRPLLFYLLERVKRSRLLDRIIVATSDLEIDQPIADFAKQQGVGMYQGSEADVLDRYYEATRDQSLDCVVRITADCPLLDGQVLDWFISAFLESPELDYMGTAPTFPEGYDMEIFKLSALEKAWNEANRSLEREHVTAYIWNHPELFQIKRLDYPSEDLAWMRVTVDEKDDFEAVKAIIEHFHPDKPYFVLNDIIDLLKNVRPELQEINQHLIRNQGYLESLKKEGRDER